ncbi:MAG: benzoate-CoA ligase family protein, partial [Bradymonadia bacterium]
EYRGYDSAGIALLNSGLQLGQRVYIILPDCPPFAWSFFGALKAGAVVAMGNPISSPSLLTDVIDYITPHTIITTQSVYESLLALKPELGSLNALITCDMKTEADPERPIGTEHCLVKHLTTTVNGHSWPSTYVGSPGIWLFTSGSTGRPKAAMHCHGDFQFNTEVYAKQTIGYHRDDVCVSVPRLFFGYATGTNLMFPFAVGATVGLFVEKPTADRIAWAIDYYQATMLTSVPTLMARLLDLQSDATESLHSLRFCLSAGEALPPALLERWQARFQTPVFDGIGSAEMFHIYLTNKPGDIKPGSLGTPVNGYTVRILPADAEGPGVDEVPVGEAGVLWVKGDSVATGYWLDRSKSWQTFFGHWCRTGDLFTRDEAGYYWFRGRADHLLKISGQWVSPLEVEHCLTEHPAVLEAAVVPIEVEGLKRTRACIALRPGAAEIDGDTLKAWVGQRIAKYKTPHEISFYPSLPKNDRGKIDKGQLT